MTALESALEAQSAPGSNLKGAVDGANWCFLLPQLDLGRILTLGSPSPSTLVTLSKLGEEVAIWAKTEDHDRVRGVIAKHQSANVSLLSAEGGGHLPLPDDVIDLVLLAQPRLVRSLLGQTEVRAEIERVLKPSGLAYMESRRRSAPLWIAPASGDMRFAAPVGDSKAIEYLERRFLRPLLRRQLVTHPGRVAARSVLVNRLLRRRALLVTAAGDEAPVGPPAYVQAIAAKAGASIEGPRWAFAAPGEYASQKVLLFLFGTEDREPRAVVKTIRDASHNPRLENEWRALTFLHERRIGDEGTRPSPLFFGYHAGLAILGETAVAGEPFLERAQTRGECPHARNVVEWLLRLGVATAHRPESPPGCAARLQALLARFSDLYRPDERRSRFLADQVATLAGSGDDLRLVFQHGDPGPWNIVVTPDGRPGFLDWEGADPEGMPLWDVFHFVRSFALSISRKAGTRDPLRSFAEQVLAPSEVSGLLVETAERFCSETHLSPRLVEPLFHLCWMQRAIKEASRLPPDRLETGRYFNLLRLSIDHRDSPGLHSLFSLAAAA